MRRTERLSQRRQSPVLNGRAADASAPRYFRYGELLRRMEDDHRAPNVLEGMRAIGGDPHHQVAVFVPDEDADSL